MALRSGKLYFQDASINLVPKWYYDRVYYHQDVSTILVPKWYENPGSYTVRMIALIWYEIGVKIREAVLPGC